MNFVHIFYLTDEMKCIFHVLQIRFMASKHEFQRVYLHARPGIVSRWDLRIGLGRVVRAAPESSYAARGRDSQCGTPALR